MRVPAGDKSGYHLINILITLYPVVRTEYSVQILRLEWRGFRPNAS